MTGSRPKTKILTATQELAPVGRTGNLTEQPSEDWTVKTFPSGW